jgi:hypothetical protein
LDLGGLKVKTGLFLREEHYEDLFEWRVSGEEGCKNFRV